MRAGRRKTYSKLLFGCLVHLILPTTDVVDAIETIKKGYLFGFIYRNIYQRRDREDDDGSMERRRRERQNGFLSMAVDLLGYFPFGICVCWRACAANSEIDIYLQ